MRRIDNDHAAAVTRCIRCGHRLTFGKREAIARVVGLAMTLAMLTMFAVLVPFLNLSSGARVTSVSLVSVVGGFSHGIMAPLALAVLGFLLVLPLTRLLLLVFAGSFDGVDVPT